MAAGVSRWQIILGRVMWMLSRVCVDAVVLIFFCEIRTRNYVIGE